MFCSSVHMGSTKVVVCSCSVRTLWKHWSALQRKPWTLTLNRKVSKADSARDGLDFCCWSTATGLTCHSKFWGILSLSWFSAKSQHTTWRGFLLRANLTNHLGWDQHFLSLCLLIGVSQQDHRKVVQTVNKEWASGSNTVEGVVSGEVSNVNMYILILYLFDLCLIVIYTHLYFRVPPMEWHWEHPTRQPSPSSLMTMPLE